MLDPATNDPSAEALADEYLARLRAGERPTVEEYADRFPGLAEEIRAFFPALLLVEDFKPGTDDLTGSFAVGQATSVVASERLGDYRILREVGRGGMGVVFEAEQESLGRRVALKVMIASAPPDAGRALRFDREARAGANLHHTNLVPVFGVGRHEETPYYVMQFIEGAGLDQVLAELKRLHDREGEPDAVIHPVDLTAPSVSVARCLRTGRFLPSEPIRASGVVASTATASAAPASDSTSTAALMESSNLGPGPDSARRFAEGVAEIGAQVAEALAYAHAQGILHRDIKPANLLLDTHGTAWVTDFGLAKAVGGDVLTHTGDLIGTVRYMAPERFRGRCAEPADVYALGLTLYELLAHRPAFTGADHQSLLHQITHEGPPRLRSLNPSVPQDLETIVQKAIEKDPLHRYKSAADLAADLRSFREDRPIAARRLSPLGATYRWCRRNRAVASLLLAVQLLLAGGLVVSVVAAGEFKKVASAARAAETRADEKADAERRQRERADEKADAERRQRENLERALAEKRAVLEFLTSLLSQTSPGSAGGGALTIDDLLKRSDEMLARRFESQPAVEAEIRRAMGESLALRGRFDKGAKQLKIALALCTEHLGAEHRDTLRSRALAAYWKWPMLSGNLAADLKPFEEVIEIQRRVLGPEDRDTIETTDLIISVLINSGKFDEAYAMAERTLEAATRVRGPDDSHTLGIRGLTGEAQLFKRWDVESARERIREAYEGQKRALGPYNWFTTQHHARLGEFYATVGDFDDAVRELDGALEEFQRIATPDNPTTSNWAVLRIGVLRERGDHKRSSALIQGALDTWMKDLDPQHPGVQWCRAHLAMNRGDIESARKSFEHVKGLYMSDATFIQTGLCNYNRRLVELSAGSGEVEEATKLIEEVIKDWQPVYKGKDRWAAGDRDMLARLLAGVFDRVPGPRDVPRALALAEANVRDYPKDGQLRTTLGIAQYRARNFKDAAASLAKAAELDGDRRIAPRGFFLAMARLSTGEKDMAHAAFDEAAAWMDAEGRPDHPALVRNRAEAAVLLGVKDVGPGK
jgi:serine/threonine protein kinase/tetratricopeptide (TPR) repeat protein